MVRRMWVIVAVLVALMAALAVAEAASGRSTLPAPAVASPSGTWITPFFEDGASPGEYTFLSILNAGLSSDTVMVRFYSKSGVVITDISKTVTAGEAWQLVTGTAGGVAATMGGSGWIKIMGTGTSLVPSGFVVLPNAGNYWGLSLPFYTAAASPPLSPSPTPTATATATAVPATPTATPSPTPTLVPASTPQTLVVLAAVFLLALYWLGRKARSTRA